MPIPTVYTPIQPSPSIVMKPIVWVPNIWTAVICAPGNVSNLPETISCVPEKF